RAPLRARSASSPATLSALRSTPATRLRTEVVVTPRRSQLLALELSTRRTLSAPGSSSTQLQPKVSIRTEPQTSSACFILEGLLCRGGSWEHHDRCTAVQASTRSAPKPVPQRGGQRFAAERLPERSEAIVDADHAGARLVGASTVGQARDDDLFIEHVVDLDEGGHAFIDGVARDPVDHEQGLGAIEGVT